MGLCAFFACFRTARTSPVDDDQGKQGELAAVLDEDAGCKPGRMGACHSDPLDSPKELEELHVNRRKASQPSTKGLPSTDAKLAATAADKQELLLRAILQRAKALMPQTSVLPALPTTHQRLLLEDAQLAHCAKCLMDASRTPGVHAASRLQQALANLTQWLTAAPATPAAAASVVYVAGDALAHAEHAIRSVGQVRFWQLDNVAAFAALLSLHNNLLQQAARPQAMPQPEQQQPQLLVPVGVEIQVSSFSPPSSCASARTVSPSASATASSAYHPMLKRAVARLLLRPDWLDLLIDVLELLHFNAEYAAAAAAAGRPHEAVSAALQLWGFLTRLVKFASTHGTYVLNMDACMMRLGALLAPPSGVAPRMLALPVREDTLAPQLHVMRLLQELYDLADSKVLHAEPLAQHYVGAHWRAMVQHYEASRADPHSAASELCRVHATLLRSLVRHPGAPVRQAFAALKAVDWLLKEMSLECQFLAAEAAAGASDDTSGSSSGGSSDDDDSSSSSMGGSPNAGQDADRRLQRRGAPPPSPAQAGGKFAFTYDLNEDVERLLELEAQLGEEVALNGFEYDEEGRQLMERSAQLQQVAEEQVAAAAAAAAAVQPSADGRRDQLQAASGRSLNQSQAGCASICSSGGDTARRMSGVPRLSLAGLRTGSVSSMAASKAGTPQAHGGSMHGSSRALRGTSATSAGWANLSLEESSGEEDDDPPSALQLPGGARPAVPSPRIRELTTQPALRQGSQGELHLMVPSSSTSGRAVGRPAGLPPLAARPLGVPPLKVASLVVLGHGSAGGEEVLPLASSSRSSLAPNTAASSARRGGVQSSARSVHFGESSAAASASGALSNLSAPKRPTGEAARAPPVPSSSWGMPELSLTNLATPAATPVPGWQQAAPQGVGSARPPQPPIPALNLSTLRSDSRALNDTSRTQALSSVLRSNGSLPHGSAMDSAATPPTAPPSSCRTAAGGGGGALSSSSPHPPAPTYAALSQQKLLCQDLQLHELLLKVLMDLLLLPSGGLDTAYVHQHPMENGLLHAEYILLWHLNAPTNGELVQELYKAAQQRAAAALRHAQQRSARKALPPVPPPAGGKAAPTTSAATSDEAALRPAATARLLRLLCRPLFDASRYTNLQFQAHGSSGSIYRARMEAPAADPVAGAGGGAGAGALAVVVKTIEVPTSSYSGGVLQDVYGEVSIMERFRGCDSICQLLDYGMANDAYWLVMKRYRCSLAEWRARQKALAPPPGVAGPAPAASRIPQAPAVAMAAACRMYLAILQQVVDALKLLAGQNVVHFDLKCANVLVEPLPGVKDGELWAPVEQQQVPLQTAAASDACTGMPATPAGVPFRCVIADFGEARAYRSAAEAFTARNRGTEVFKSPEMLLLNVGTGAPSRLSAASGAGTPPAAAPGGRQQLARAGLASDVWSLGCLAYELLSGTVLFGSDYASATHRVAFGQGENLQLTEPERARLGDVPQLTALVEWVLARDPAKRPSLEQISTRIAEVQAQLGGP